MDNCGTSRKHLSGKVGSPSSFDLTSVDPNEIFLLSFKLCSEFLRIFTVLIMVSEQENNIFVFDMFLTTLFFDPK